MAIFEATGSGIICPTQRSAAQTSLLLLGSANFVTGNLYLVKLTAILTRNVSGKVFWWTPKSYFRKTVWEE